MTVEVAMLDESCGVRGFSVKIRGPENSVLIDPNPGSAEDGDFSDNRDRLFSQVGERQYNAIMATHDHRDHCYEMDHCIREAGLTNNRPAGGDNAWGFVQNGHLKWIPTDPERDKRDQIFYEMDDGDFILRRKIPHGSYEGGPLRWHRDDRITYMNGYLAQLDDARIFITGDVHGQIPNRTVSELRRFRPQAIVMDGFNNSLGSEEAARAREESMYDLMEGLPELEHLVVGHHLFRGDAKPTAELKRLKEIAKKTGTRAQIRTVADYPVLDGRYRGFELK